MSARTSDSLGLDLAGSESQLERLFDAALDAVVAMDPDGLIAAWNRKAEEMFGWARAEAIGRELAELIIPAPLRPAHYAGLRQYWETGGGPVINRRVEVSAIRRDGSEFPVELTVIPLRFQAGEIFYAFIRDISVRKNAEALAQRRAYEAQILYEAAALAAQGGSADELLSRCLEKMCELTGWVVGHVYSPDSAVNPVRLLSTEIWHIADPRLDDLRAATRSYSMRKGQGLPGRIWASGKPEWIDDIRSDPAFVRNRIFSDRGLNAAFGFPVLLEGRLQAVLEFFSPTAQRPDDALMLVAHSLAEQLGRVLERQRALEHEQILMRELNHRVGNTLAVVGSVFRRTAERAGSIRELKDNFEARLQSLASAHHLLAGSAWTSATMRQIVDATIAPYGGEDASHWGLSGPEVHLPARQIMPLTMILHELATNAAKYGALSVPGGQVRLTWELVEDPAGPQLAIDWTEVGGPPARQPEQRGYGSTLIEELVGKSLEGRVSLAFEPAGLQARMVVPVTDTSATKPNSVPQPFVRA